MAKGITIGIASDTKDFATGVQRGVIEPTQDAADALDAVAASGDDAGRQLETSMRTAQRGTDELQGDIRALGAQVREAGSSSKQIGTKFKASTDEASEGVSTLKENTASNLKEVAASFDGTAQGMSDGVQGLVAEVLEGFGPGGLIAGAVLAGGIGLITSGLQASDEATQQWQEDVATLAQTWIDANRNGRVTSQQIADGLKTMATQTDRNKVSLSDVEQQAKALHLPFADLARVYAAGGDATQYAIDKTDALIEHNQSLMQVSRTASRAGVGDIGRTNAATAERITQLEAQRKKLLDVQKQTDAAAKDEQEWLKAGGPDLELKAQRTQNYADSIQSALNDAGADWQDFATKEGGVNLTAYEKHLKAKVKAIRDYQANVSAASQLMNADALGYIESLGADAAPLLEQFINAPKKQQGALASLWADLGRRSSSSYNSALQAGLPDALKPPKLGAPDTSEFEAAIGSVVYAQQRYLDQHPLLASFSVNRPGKVVP